MPAKTPIKYKIPTIFIFSFTFLFVLNNTNSPTPAFTATPDINTGIDITLLINNSVKITDEAQFGINPIKPATIGPNITFLLIKCAIVSSPIYAIIPLSTSVMKNMNIVMFKVCLIADVTIPSSQWQCSCSQISSIFSSCSSTFSFLNILITKSIINPATIPKTSFIPSIVNIVPAGTASVNNIGNISSDVAKYTEINVPSVITLPAYKLVADTENPHCGNIPTIAPKFS